MLEENAATVQVRKRDGVRNWPGIIVVGLFCLCLALPHLIHVAQLGSDTTKYEKREMEPFPPLGTKMINYIRFPRKFERYFNDHLGPRSLLIKLFARFQYCVLKKSPLQKVMLGKDGWLFFNQKFEMDPVGAYSGNVQFTPQEMDEITNYLKSWKSWLNSRGIKFYLLIPPHKFTVYPEYLPSRVVKIHPRDRTDNFIEHIREQTDIKLIDARQAIVDQKSGPYPLFFKTDTHWTRLGAFIAFQELMNVVRKDFPNIPDQKIDDYTIKESTVPGGDMANMILLSDQIWDWQYDMIPKNGEKYKIISDNPTGGVKEPIITTNNDQSLPKGVVFRDSFSVFLQPMLSQDLSRAVYVWEPHLDADIIAREKPDFVVLEVLERLLHRVLGGQLPPAGDAG